MTAYLINTVEFPVEFPVMSLGETLIKPTAMLYRNLASMDVEESIRANPVDGVVLMCGCDKTTPSLVMGASSVDLPTLVISGGPMMKGKFKGKEIGTSDVWRFAEAYKLGELSQKEFIEAEACMARTPGHCAVMGTASTMATMVEALGLSLPQNAAIPAADVRRKVLAQHSGRRIVEMVNEDQKISKVLTRAAFENAIRVNAATGGSTNFVIHLLAIAGRIGVELDLNDFAELDYTIWTIDYTTYYVVFGIVILLAFAIIAYALVKRKIKSRLQNAQLKMLKTDSIQQAFAGVELNLIELLHHLHLV